MRKLNRPRLIFSVLIWISLVVLAIKLVEATGVSEWFFRVPLYLLAFYFGLDYVWEE